MKPWRSGSPGHDNLISLLLREFKKGRGVRVGEASVLSHKLHLIRPQNPETVYILLNADAGQVLYNRRETGEVLHLDIFHELAEVNHRLVAQAVREAVRLFVEENPIPEASGVFRPSRETILDHMDIQTGTGGGRVSGKLNMGMRESVRKAHRNHVHMAMGLPENCLTLVFYLVDEVERAIMDQGIQIQIRKVERLVHEEGRSPLDLTSYLSPFDSMLLENRDDSHAARLEVAWELASHFETRENLSRILDTIASSEGRTERIPIPGSTYDALSKLESHGFITRQRGEIRLTEAGEWFRGYLRRYAPEIDAGVRNLLRKIPAKRWSFRGQGRGLHARARVPRSIAKMAQAPSPGESYAPLAVVETVIEAARRFATSDRYGGLRISPRDIRIYKGRPNHSPEVCLLIDASASMMGRRIWAAKNLVRHLALATRTRLTAFIFQERSCHLLFSRTRNRRALEKGLSHIRPSGLTPLACALDEVARFLARRRHRTLLVLITDGVPTMGRWSPDPVKDALTCARAIERYRIPFICVGLAPNRDFLRRLTEVSGGQLFVLDEFERDNLIGLIRHSGCSFVRR